MRYTLAPKIKCDLEEITEWIAQDSPHRATKVVREIRAELSKIGEEARLAVFGRYVVLFWADGDAVRFERVVYGGRDLPSLYR